MDADLLALRLKAKRSGRQYLCKCPAHDDHSASLTFWQGHSAIRFKCWTGCSTADVLAALRRGGALARPPGRLTLQAKAKAADAAAAARNQELALRLWAEAEPAIGTGVEVYFDYRRRLGLDGFTDVERRHLLTEVLRFHPWCPCAGDRRPAMIALMRDCRSDAPAGVHRTYFDAAWRKLGKGMMLGPCGRAAVKLAPSNGRLVVTEGIETAVGCRLLGDRPTWAMTSAGNMKSLPLIDGVMSLLVRADHDASGAGWAAARGVAATWREGERTVEITMPDCVGEDYADVAARLA